ncbi:MAG: hypothetical protein A3F11_02115 [Gammaproteobacteria bacterium RIFCSPHIGHO2_12_FULL_37_14]|nr:MAG: hypothetical protein A3F11_02115 [Gammaproteobacteria bacterium RIFCSPHIGHO2_12_FULL_37_14]
MRSNDDDDKKKKKPDEKFRFTPNFADQRLSKEEKKEAMEQAYKKFAEPRQSKEKAISEVYKLQAREEYVTNLHSGFKWNSVFKKIADAKGNIENKELINNLLKSDTLFKTRDDATSALTTLLHNEETNGKRHNFNAYSIQKSTTDNGFRIIVHLENIDPIEYKKPTPY